MYIYIYTCALPGLGGVPGRHGSGLLWRRSAKALPLWATAANNNNKNNNNNNSNCNRNRT